MSIFAGEETMTIELDRRSLISINEVPQKASTDRITLRRGSHDHEWWVGFTVGASVPSSSSSTQGAAESGSAIAPEYGSFRQFLQKLRRPFDDDPLFSFLLGLIAALPLLLCLRILTKEAAEEEILALGVQPGFRDELAGSIKTLLLFHVFLYSLPAFGGLSYSMKILTDLANSVESILPGPIFENSITFRGIPYRLAPAFLGVLVPSMLACRSRSLEDRPRRMIFAITGKVSIAFLLLVSLALFAGIAQGALEQGPENYRLAYIFCAVLIPLFLSVRALHRLLSGCRAPLSTALAFLVVVLACGFFQGTAPLEKAERDWSEYAQGGMAICLGLSMIVSIASVGFFAARAAFPGKKASRRASLGLYALAALVVFPFGSVIDKERSISVDIEIMNAAWRLDSLVLMLWIACAMWIVYRGGSSSQRIGALVRSIGLLGASAILFSPRVTWLFIPVNFLLGYGLLLRLTRPASYWGTLEPLFEPVVERRPELLAGIIEVNAVETAYDGYRKTMLGKVASGDLGIEDCRTRIDAYRGEIGKLNDSYSIGGRSYVDIALEFGPHGSAWENAAHGVKWAVAFAIPWIAVTLREWLSDPLSPWANPFLDLFVETALLLAKWAALGFAFGFFYPYILGKNGLRKGLCLFAVVLLSSLPILSISNTSAAEWQASLFWIMQMFVECMLLGLVSFDYMILRLGRYDWRMLFEVHDLSSIGVTVTSIAAAIGVAVTTLLSSQAASLVATALQLFIPQAPVDIPKK